MKELSTLALRAIDGDRRAADDLCRRLLPYALTVAREHESPMTPAEDLQGAAVLEVWERLPRWRGAPFDRWAWAVMRYGCMSARWKLWGRADRAALAPMSDAAGCVVPGPVAVDRGAVARAAVAGLPARQRAVVLSHYVYGHTHAEIAAGLGCKESTSRSLARHGIARLREQLVGAA